MFLRSAHADLYADMRQGHNTLENDLFNKKTYYNAPVSYKRINQRVPNVETWTFASVKLGV